MFNLLILLIFLSLICLAAGAFWYLGDPQRQQRRRLRRRLTSLEGPAPPAIASLLKDHKLGGLPFLQASIQGFSFLESGQTLLLQADLSWPLPVFLLLSGAAGFVGIGLGFWKWGWLGALAGGGLGLLIPYKAVQFKKRRRIGKFEKQLPDALELLARGLKAGHGFTSGLQLVAGEMPAPLGPEFLKTFQEYNHGLELNLALVNFRHRIDLKDLKFFTTAVMIQRETGGNLADILEKNAALIRERFKLRNQIKALTAEGRLSGLILTMLPPVIALILFAINPEYVLVLVRHPLGRMMAISAVFFQVLGMLTIRKIVNIKV